MSGVCIRCHEFTSCLYSPLFPFICSNRLLETVARSTGRFAGSDHQLLFVLELSFSAVMSMQRRPLRLKVPEAFMAVNTVVDHLDEPFF